MFYPPRKGEKKKFVAEIYGKHPKHEANGAFMVYVSKNIPNDHGKNQK